MNCKNTNNKLIFYLENSLDKTEKAGIEKHLSECEKCAADLSVLKLSFVSIETEKQIENNSFISTQILAKIETKTQKKSIYRFVLQPLVASFIVFFGIWIGQNISVNYFDNQSNITQNEQIIEQSEQYAIDDFSDEEYYFIVNQ